MALIAGCGADEPASTTAAGTSTSDVPLQTETALVAALGDSITEGSGAKTDFEYWAHEARPELEFRNCGIFGQRTDEIAQRLDDCAEDANILIVQGGINDIAQGRPVADAADDLTSMVRRGQELSLDVYLTDVLPWNNAHPAADGSIAELNRLIGEIGAEEGVPVIGFHDALENPREPGVMKAEYTDDGDHPSTEGYRVLGDLVAEQIQFAGA